MEYVVGAGDDADGGGGTASREGRGGDGRGHNGGVEAPVIVGGDAVPRDPYDSNVVDTLVRQGNWTALEEYVIGFVPEGVRHLHPELLLLLRRAEVQVGVDGWEGADAILRHRIIPLIDSFSITPYARLETLESKIKAIENSLLHEGKIWHPEDLEDKINDYMRFYFKEIMGPGQPDQGRSKLWDFVILIQRCANGQGIFRCLLCQFKIRKDSLRRQHATLLNHLQSDCPSMNDHTCKLLGEAGAKETRSGKRPLIYQATPKKDQRPSKRSCHIPATTSEDKKAVRGLEIMSKIRQSGYGVGAYLDLLDRCVHAIGISSDQNVTMTEILRGKEILLDMVLNTNVQRDHCVELRNWFDLMKCCDHQQEWNLDPSHEMEGFEYIDEYLSNEASDINHEYEYIGDDFRTNDGTGPSYHRHPSAALGGATEVIDLLEEMNMYPHHLTDDSASSVQSMNHVDGQSYRHHPIAGSSLMQGTTEVIGLFEGMNLFQPQQSSSEGVTEVIKVSEETDDTQKI